MGIQHKNKLSFLRIITNTPASCTFKLEQKPPVCGRSCLNHHKFIMTTALPPNVFPCLNPPSRLNTWTSVVCTVTYVECETARLQASDGQTSSICLCACLCCSCGFPPGSQSAHLPLISLQYFSPGSSHIQCQIVI